MHAGEKPTLAAKMETRRFGVTFVCSLCACVFVCVLKPSSQPIFFFLDQKVLFIQRPHKGPCGLPVFECEVLWK